MSRDEIINDATGSCFVEPSQQHLFISSQQHKTFNYFWALWEVLGNAGNIAASLSTPAHHHEDELKIVPRFEVVMKSIKRKVISCCLRFRGLSTQNIDTDERELLLNESFWRASEDMKVRLRLLRLCWLETFRWVDRDRLGIHINP